MEEKNPKKSKALIITFILVLLVLILGYYLIFKNNIFRVEKSNSVNKIFQSLFPTSKNKPIKTIEDPSKNTKINEGDNTIQKRTATISTDEKGNKYVMGEAGEIFKKGDVLYISGFNSNGAPILKKAIANEKARSLVFGVAGQDMKVGEINKVVIEGIIEGVSTKIKEGTWWAVGNTLYLSDKILGGMTKNPPKTPSYTVPVGSVVKVDIINGVIRIGNLANNKDIKRKDVNDLGRLNSSLLLNVPADMRDYWNSVFGGDGFKGFGTGGGYFGPDGNYVPPVIPVPTPWDNECSNGADNPLLCTTKSGKCLNGATNPPSCTVTGDNKCLNGADNPTLCTTKGGKCLNGATNPPSCTVTGDNKCLNGADNPTLCTTKGGKCLNGATNPPSCTTPVGGDDGNGDDGDGSGGEDEDGDGDPNTCPNGAINPPLCTNMGGGTGANQCKLIEDNPLTFTPEEKAELDMLLRKFYLVSPTLRTIDDIVTIYNEIDQQNNFIDEIKSLTNQCYAQIDNKGLLTDINTGKNWVRNGNPWYPTELYKNTGTYPYTPGDKGYVNYDDLISLSYLKKIDYSCRDILGYYYGKVNKEADVYKQDILGFTKFKVKPGDECAPFSPENNMSLINFNSNQSCGLDESIPYARKNQNPGHPMEELLNAGCQWKEGVDMKATERLLNIW